MPLCYYFHNVEDRTPARYATIYPRGAVVNGAQANVNTVTVFAGHEIQTGDKFLAFVDDRTPLAERVFTVSTAASTSLIFSSEAASFPDRAVLVGIGTDSGSTYPTLAYDGSSLTVYKDPGSSTAWTNANVDVPPSGEITFHANGRPVWSLIRNAYGRPTRVYVDVGPEGPVLAGGSALPATGVPRQTFVLEGAAGTADIVYCWLKQSDDSYDWIEVISAP